MTQPEQFEVLILGSGEGGKYLAWHMAQSGRRTAVVERRWIGGSCPNTNCLPSKNEIWSAKVADLVGPRRTVWDLDGFRYDRYAQSPAAQARYGRRPDCHAPAAL